MPAYPVCASVGAATLEDGAGLSISMVAMSASLMPRALMAGRTSSEMDVQRQVLDASITAPGNQSTKHMASWESTIRSA